MPGLSFRICSTILPLNCPTVRRAICRKVSPDCTTTVSVSTSLLDEEDCIEETSEISTAFSPRERIGPEAGVVPVELSLDVASVRTGG